MADDQSTAGVWTVWRQGDDGNPDIVRRRLSRIEANRLVAELESHGHKQLYWTEQDAKSASVWPATPTPHPGI